jgi:hypothetical protein
MNCQSPAQEVPLRGIHPRALHRLFPMALLLSGLAGLTLPEFTSAAVYTCVDEAGKTVLTNKQSGFRQCHALTDMTQPGLTAPGTSAPPRESGPPVSSETPPSFSDPPPQPQPRPAEHPYPSMGMPAAPNPSVSSSPPPPQPCQRGLNPLNPLMGLPCAPPDQSDADPPNTAPVPPE